MSLACADAATPRPSAAVRRAMGRIRMAGQDGGGPRLLSLGDHPWSLPAESALIRKSRVAFTHARERTIATACDSPSSSPRSTLAAAAPAASRLPRRHRDHDQRRRVGHARLGRRRGRPGQPAAGDHPRRRDGVPAADPAPVRRGLRALGQRRRLLQARRLPGRRRPRDVRAHVQVGRLLRGLRHLLLRRRDRHLPRVRGDSEDDVDGRGRRPRRRRRTAHPRRALDSAAAAASRGACSPTRRRPG